MRVMIRTIDEPAQLTAEITLDAFGAVVHLARPDLRARQMERLWPTLILRSARAARATSASWCWPPPSPTRRCLGLGRPTA